MAQDDDEVWRAIVDNYGERPAIDPDLPDAETETEEPTEHPGPARFDATPDPAPDPAPESGWNEEYIDADWSTDRFVPPPPPPLPQTTTDRYAAWAGVFGAPAILLVCLVIGFNPGQFISYLLVLAFIGGFLYLVITMSREPRDPGDNGAVL